MGAGAEGSSRRLSPVGFSCTIFEEPASAWAEALAIIIFGASPILLLEASTEEEGGVFTDSRIASKTLAILLFYGVPVALGTFDHCAEAK